MVACLAAPAQALAEESLLAGDMDASGADAAFEMPLAQQTVDALPSDDPQALFNAYAQQRLDAALPNASTLASQALPEKTTLTDAEKELLDALKVEVAKVASGTRTSTTFEISYADLGLPTSFTAEDLGVSSLGNRAGINEEALNAVSELLHKVDVAKAILALCTDCPYEMYWFDGTEGYTSSIPIEANVINGKLIVNAKLILPLPVSADYRGADKFTMQNPLAAKVGTAIAKAQSIVDGSKGKSVVQRLAAYRDAICEEVSYDHSTGGKSYGDPWQLISVFDGDSSTNVVCEGYAKAFQYLCDLSGFEDVNCYTVAGAMAGGTGAGNHMWNLVQMDDYENYLVDVTNCDAGTIGAPDKLFLAWGPSGSVDGSYTFSLGGNSSIVYAYGADTRSLYDAIALQVSPTAYKAPTVADRTSIDAVKIVVTGSYAYDGKAKVPAANEIRVTLNGVQLAYGADYIVRATNNTAAGTATAMVYGQNAYKGRASTQFAIAKAKPSVQLAAQSKVYTGKALTYSGKLTGCDAAASVAYAYYADRACTKRIAAANVVAAGTYYVKATVAADANHEAATSPAAVFTISKAAQEVQAAKRAYSVKFAQVKKKAQKVAVAFRSTSGGKVTYKAAKTAGGKVSIAKNGKVKVKKGTKKG
ncbi:MAG TPA: hypothetical protein DCP91_05535, partial [Eggerthellaceae bacterium]|nr:hypothetical protein [Eggerthellaceae bacterium]